MRQGKIHIVLSMIFLTLVLSVMGCGPEDKYVTQVKTGTMYMEPNIQIGKAFDEFFANPKWRSYTEGKGKYQRHIVEFTGDCTWYNAPAKCTIHFIVGDTEFQLQWVAINDVQMDEEESVAILHKALTNRDY